MKTRMPESHRFQFGLARLALLVACIGAAIPGWKYLFFHEGAREIGTMIVAFLSAMAASGGAIGTVGSHFLWGMLIGLALAVGWIAFLIILVATGIHGF